MDGNTIITALIIPIYFKIMWIMRKLGQIEAKLDMINNKDEGDDYE